ncbi:MAG TPA: IS21-like element helper ATPase IstB [Kofleriaceae bacterium]|nr:IS21-like element helper ATPase IstB [Kofleriaceae bacterium]
MTTTAATSPLAALLILLRALKLPTIARHAEEVAQLAERDGWTFVRYLHHLVELESDERRRRRIERNRRQSELPADKTLATLQRARLPTKVAKMLPTLCEGSFVERGDNLLAFGRPGRGKTHLVCAIGHALIQRGYRVLFIATYALVQRLLAAKRDLRLEDELGILDGFDAVILDDLGYVQQNRDEMEVLFTFLAERYERRTVMITSNLVFSEWDRIFKDPMTTAAAIDRLVHHAVILEMTGASVRIEEAQAQIGRSQEGLEPPDDLTSRAGVTTTDHATPSAAPTAPGSAPTTTTPTTTTPTVSALHSIPGAAPTAPGPATNSTPGISTEEAPTNDRKQQIKQRVHQRQSETDGEM